MDLNSALSPYPLADYQNWARQASNVCPQLPYLKLSGQNNEKALALFKLNTEIAEAIFPALLVLETVFRNSINAHLKIAYGSTWFQGGTSNFFTGREKKQIVTAKSRISRNTGSVSINDELLKKGLSFGFWSIFFNRMISGTNVSHLHRIFKPKAATPPHQLSFQIEEMVKFRNKVAHFGCIIDLDLERLYMECCELIGWLSNESRAWYENNCRFRSVYPGMDIIVGGEINKMLVL